MSDYQHINVTPRPSGFGVEITGLDLTVALSAQQVDEIKRAWHAHGVAFFPDQLMTPGTLEQFTQSMGDFGVVDFVEPMPGHANVLELRREPEETASHFGSSWHSDFSFQQAPPAATILFGQTIPPVGGDTLFADGRAAYLALSGTMQQFLETLRGVHSAAIPYSKEGFFGTDDDTSRTLKIVPSDRAKERLSHPVIRTHPATAEKILWVNPNYTLAIEGLHSAESEALLTFLCDFAIRDEFIYRHQWQKNMLTMWDNRRVQHFADTGFDGHRRVMWRTTTAGTVPV